MEKDTVEFKRKITPIGGSFGFTIPKELLEFLGLTEGSELVLSGFNGKYGKYFAAWKKPEDITKEEVKEILLKESGLNEQ